MIDLKNDFFIQNLFEALPVTNYWSSVALTYPETCKTGLKKVLPLTLRCYANLPYQHLHIGSQKYRNRLEVTQDIC